MDYDVVCVEGYYTLETAIKALKIHVKSKIQEGWQVQGGVAIVNEAEEGYSAIQAIVKADIKPEPANDKTPTVIQL